MKITTWWINMQCRNGGTNLSNAVNQGIISIMVVQEYTTQTPPLHGTYVREPRPVTTVTSHQWGWWAAIYPWIRRPCSRRYHRCSTGSVMSWRSVALMPSSTRVTSWACCSTTPPKARLNSPRPSSSRPPTETWLPHHTSHQVALPRVAVGRRRPTGGGLTHHLLPMSWRRRLQLNVSCLSLMRWVTLVNIHKSAFV